MKAPGDWQGLDNPVQGPRYAVIAARINEAPQPLRLLDVGCSQGLVLKWIQPPLYYLGVDISEQAITDIPSPWQGVKMDIEQAHLPEKFNVILLNEVLYYLKDPKGTMNRLINENLEVGGQLIVSIYDRGLFSPNRKAMNVVEKFPIKTRVEITDTVNRKSWTIYTIKP